MSSKNPFSSAASAFGKGSSGSLFAGATSSSIFGGVKSTSTFGPSSQPSVPAGGSPFHGDDDESRDAEANDNDTDFIAMDMFSDEPVVIDSLDAYIGTLLKYLEYHDWTATLLIVPLLSLDDKHVFCKFLQVENPVITLNSQSNPVWQEIISSHLSVIYYVSTGQWFKAYSMQGALIKYLSDEVKESSSNYILPLASAFASDLRHLAKMAQAASVSLDEDVNEDYSVQVADKLTVLYRMCAMESRLNLQASKKVAVFDLTVVLMQIYFEANRMALVKPLLRSIDNLNKKFLARITLSSLITYNFYFGKKAMFDSDLATANKALGYAFNYCPEKYIENKRRVLIYWIPVKMFLGEIPLESMLEDYNLNEFKLVAQGVREGNICLLRQGIVANRRFFMSHGIYLMFEKLAQKTYLSLFKRLAAIVQETSERSSHIRIDMFMHLLKFLGEDFSHIDEVVCVLATLIEQQKVKGYISKTHNIVVLSKKNPFGDN